MTTKTIVQQHAPNLETLKKAFANGDVALMECKVAATGEVVAALCAVGREEDGSNTMTPFAVFLNGNPFELLMPPDPDRPGKFIGDPDDTPVEVKEEPEVGNTYDVTITGTVTKTLRVVAPSDIEAIEKAHGRFMVGSVSDDEHYDEQTESCVLVPSEGT
jgi:hypothetical protein